MGFFLIFKKKTVQNLVRLDLTRELNFLPLHQGLAAKMLHVLLLPVILPYS